MSEEQKTKGEWKPVFLGGVVAEKSKSIDFIVKVSMSLEVIFCGIKDGVFVFRKVDVREQEFGEGPSARKEKYQTETALYLEAPAENVITRCVFLGTAYEVCYGPFKVNGVEVGNALQIREIEIPDNEMSALSDLTSVESVRNPAVSADS